MKKIECCPVTSEQWPDLETLFGANGACAGCWCMWWRLKRSVWQKQKGAGNRNALKKLTASQSGPGIIAYVDGKPAGWVSFGPRTEFPVLDNSRLFKRIDTEPVWSIVCFFIARPYRRSGLSRKLIDAAIRHSKRKGAHWLEAYPVDPKKDRMPELFAFTGFASAFRQAGFHEVIRRSETRPMMRLKLKK